MSNDTGTPPAAESASRDVNPQSRPTAASELDSGWFDADEPAKILAIATTAADQPPPELTSATTTEANAAVANATTAANHPEAQIAQPTAEIPSTAVEPQLAQPTAEQPSTAVESRLAQPAGGATDASAVGQVVENASSAADPIGLDIVVTAAVAAADGGAEANGKSESGEENCKEPGKERAAATADPPANSGGQSAGSVIPQSLSPVVLASPGALPSVPPAATLHTENQPTKPEQPSSDVATAAELKPTGQTDSLQSNQSNQPTAKDEPAGEAEPSAKSIPIAKTASATTSPARVVLASPRKTTRYVVIGAAVMAAGLALVLRRPNPNRMHRVGTESSPAMQQPAAIQVVPGERLVAPETIASAVPPVATPVLAAAAQSAAESAAAQETQGAPVVPTGARAAASTQPGVGASATASAAASAAAPKSGESFADAFAKNAAKKNAKWAEMKVPAGKSDATASTKGNAPNAAPGKPAAQANPLDVLKRLEESRKSHKQ